MMIDKQENILYEIEVASGSETIFKTSTTEKPKAEELFSLFKVKFSEHEVYLSKISYTSTREEKVLDES